MYYAIFLTSKIYFFSIYTPPLFKKLHSTLYSIFFEVTKIAYFFNRFT